MASLQGEKNKAQNCRERNITESLLYQWQQEFMEKTPSLYADGRQSSQDDEKEEQMADLEGMVGRLTMELEVLKKSTSWQRSQCRKNGL